MLFSADAHFVRSSPLIRALTLDLDDTLWPIMPVIERAEAALQAFLTDRAPAVAQRWSIQALRTLREEVAARHPHLAHDYSQQRRLTLQHALADGGSEKELLDAAYSVFMAARNEVDLYPDVLAALTRIGAARRLAALTNGNADLELIGISEHFHFSLAARDHGAAKPDPGIFLAACRRLDLPPAHVLHVGDDPELDVAGAARAGLRTCWINRRDERWPASLPPPDVEVRTLSELADWIDSGPLVQTNRHSAAATP